MPEFTFLFCYRNNRETYKIKAPMFCDALTKLGRVIQLKYTLALVNYNKGIFDIQLLSVRQVGENEKTKN